LRKLVFSRNKKIRGCWSRAVAGSASKTTIHAAMLASVAALALCFWQRDSLPDPKDLHPSLFVAPLQTDTSKTPFFTKAGGTTYKVTPLFEYDLYGLVVSEHDTHDFVDYVHREAGDYLNVIDLCVAWGDDARSGLYRNAHFSSGQFTCYFQFDSREAAEHFDIYQISNNHLLTEVPNLAHLLRSVHIGDEVHFHGYLVEYEHDHGFHFHRGTSTTRFDTGDGACETVYVTDAQILRSHGWRWRMGQWVAALCLVASVLAWLRMPVTLD
jgi:hypothetical protein